MISTIIVFCLVICGGVQSMSSTGFSKTKIAILGASGYTGAELMRLLSIHPGAEIKVLTGTDKSAGKPYSQIYPQFQYCSTALPAMTTWEASRAEIEACDVAFCCLPHGTTQEIISSLYSSAPAIKIIDLSADFRLRDVATYETWYGKPHAAVDLQKEAIYGLVEVNRAKIRSARLIANPGCYPTAAQLSLIPLLSAGLVQPSDIIIDAKSGTSGAGRAAKEAFLFCEVADGIHAYGISSHRHAPEIEQGLTDAASTGQSVVVNFTPHLMPMTRGILETIYVKTSNSATTAAQLKKALQDAYEKEPFVHVLEGSAVPQTRHVRGSNHCFINVFDDRIAGRAIIVAAIDNLVKGASGQAIQNMNLMQGYEETTALLQSPMFP